MPTLTEFKERKKLNLLLYGETGTGKSIRAAQAAAWGSVYIFDFDQKISTIETFFANKPEYGRISFDTYSDALGSTNACKAVFAKLKDIWAKCREGRVPYNTIIFDSWTAWEQMSISQVMETNPGFKRMKMTTGMGEIAVPDQADYRIHAHVQSTFVPQLLALPMNVIVIAHTSTRVDEVTGGIERGIAAAGKLTKTLPKYFPEVHRTIVENGQYKIQVRPNGQWPANTRLQDISPSGIVDYKLEAFRSMAMIDPAVNQPGA